MPHRLIALLFTAACLALGGCGEPYPEAAIRYHAAAQEVLIAKGVCSEPHDCQRRELLFWAGGRSLFPPWREDGASLILYEAPSQAVVEAVTAKLRAVQEAEHLPGVELTVYAGSHSSRGSKVQTIFISANHPRGA